MPTVNLMHPEIVTIAPGAMVSSALSIPDVSIVGIFAPAAIDHNTLYFDVSIDGATWAPLSDPNDGKPVRVMLAAGEATTMDAMLMRPWWYARLRLTVTAAAQRKYTLMVRAAWGG